MAADRAVGLQHRAGAAFDHAVDEEPGGGRGEPSPRHPVRSAAARGPLGVTTCILEVADLGGPVAHLDLDGQVEIRGQQTGIGDVEVGRQRLRTGPGILPPDQAGCGHACQPDLEATGFLGQTSRWQVLLQQELRLLQQGPYRREPSASRTTVPRGGSAVAAVMPATCRARELHHTMW